MNNCFNYPQYYRNEFLKYKYFDVEKAVCRYKGKSLMYAFLTRFCPVGCPFCFNRSQSPCEKRAISDQFSDKGVDNLIKFCEQANMGLLIISGGGDPFVVKDKVLKLVREAKSDRIVLVTSGFWAKNYDSAKKVIDEIYNAFKNRVNPTQLVLRISISDDHAKTLGIEPALNVVNIFDTYYRNENNFDIQLKTFDNDNAFKMFLSNLAYTNISACEENVSDNFIVEKICRKKQTLTLDSGKNIVVGISKIFHTSTLPDLSQKDRLVPIIKTVDDDIFYSLRQYPATILNTDGNVGLNWSLYYNGNLCLWQSQARDTYQSIYEDDYDHVINAHFSDPLVYSFIDKGSAYRDAIINEISPKTVFRSKATALRDRLGLYLFDDERVRLYYMIRAIQDYTKEGIIPADRFLDNEELHSIVNLSITDLINLFKLSTFDMLEQELQKPFNEVRFYDFLGMIKLQHFDLDPTRIDVALKWYNNHTTRSCLKSIEDVKICEDAQTYKRVGDRQASIKDGIVAYKL